VTLRSAAVLLLAASCALAPAAVHAAGDDLPLTPRVRALAAVFVMRAAFGADDEGIEDDWKEVAHRGRPSLEVRGRERLPGGGTRLRDVGIADLATGRVVSFVWLPNESRRAAGEAILPVSEASVRADALVARLYPGAGLVLEGIERFRVAGGEGVYYEVGYAPEGEVRFPDPVVRLALDASTGNLYRVEADADWFDPAPPERGRVSAKLARRIAEVALRPPGLEAAFGAGAIARRIDVEGLSFVRPNGWPADPGPEDPDAPRRYAWMVTFQVAGTASPGQGTVYVDAATGRVLGGVPGPPP